MWIYELLNVLLDVLSGDGGYDSPESFGDGTPVPTLR